MNVAPERAETSGPNGAAVSATGELAPDEIWKEPLGRLLVRLATTQAGLSTAEVQSRLATYGPNDAATVKRSPLWLQFLARFRSPLVIILLVASGLSAATGDVASFFIVVTIVTIEHDPRLRSGSPCSECGRSAAQVCGGPGNRAARRRKPVCAGRPTGPRRYCRIDRRRSRSRGFAPARKPRSVRQPGAAHGRAVSGGEAGRRCRLGRRKSRRSIERRFCRNLRDQRHRNHRHLPYRRQDGARQSRRRAWRRNRRPPISRSAFAVSAC